MSKEWKYQLRIDLGDDLAEAARRDPNSPAIKPLADILTRHHATMKCQFDAFAEYVAEVEKRAIRSFSKKGTPVCAKWQQQSLVQTSK